MAAYLLDILPVRQTDSNGDPVPGALLYTYAANSTTPLATYTSSTGSTALDNPIAADGAGMWPQIWTAAASYKLVAKKADLTTLWTRDNVTGLGAQIAIDDANLAGPDGAGLVGYEFENDYAEDTVGAALNNLNWQKICIFDFMSPEQIADVRAAALTLDCHQALIEAKDYIINQGWQRGAIYFPRGKYRFTDEAALFRLSSLRQDIIIEGDDQLSSIIVADFYGADKAVISSKDPDALTRSSPLSFRNIGFDTMSTSGGVNPVFIDILGWGESSVTGLRLGSTNNTALRGISAQNVKVNGLVSFFASRHFNYKATTGITFDVDSGTSTITASAPIFSADDTGKLLSIFPSNPERRIIYTLTFVDATHATFTETGLNETGAAGHFQPATCTMTAGFGTLTADADCFTEDMVGLVLFVRSATAGSFGDALLRGTIQTFNAANQVVLDVAASEPVAGAFFGVAAIDMGKVSGYAGSSDVKFNQLQIEHYRGIGLATQNTDAYHITGSKIHGETSPSDAIGSMAAMWLDDHAGTFEIDLDSSCSLSDSRVHFCNLNDTINMRVATRGIIHGVVFKSDLLTDVGGQVNIDYLSSTVDFPDPYDMVSDANRTADPLDRRIQLKYVNMIGDSQTPKQYVGGDAHFTQDGIYHPQHSGPDTAIASTITWNSTPPSGTTNARYRWTQEADFVEYLLRGEYATQGTTNSNVVINFPADMPTPDTLTGTSASEIVAPAAGFISATPGGPPSASLAYIQRDAGTAFQFKIELVTGTVSARLFTISGRYPVAT